MNNRWKWKTCWWIQCRIESVVSNTNGGIIINGTWMFLTNNWIFSGEGFLRNLRWADICSSLWSSQALDNQSLWLGFLLIRLELAPKIPMLIWIFIVICWQIVKWENRKKRRTFVIHPNLLSYGVILHKVIQFLKFAHNWKQKQKYDHGLLCFVMLFWVGVRNKSHCLQLMLGEKYRFLDYVVHIIA